MKHTDLIPVKHAGHSFLPASTSQSRTDLVTRIRKLTLFPVYTHLMSTPPEPILPPSIIVSPIQWSLGNQITDAIRSEGPQFISQVWRAFFQLLGFTVSLSSGYHLQTNGQTKHKIQEIGRYLR